MNAGPPAPAGRTSDPATPAALLMPAGGEGPAWLVTPNYQAIWRYNRADTYALAIGLLSDALKGLPPPRVAWPTNDPGLSRAERRELQQLLIRNGYDIGEADGIIGTRTRAAIEAFQASAGLPADGHPGKRVFDALKVSPKAQQPQREVRDESAK